jgi:hypothetical protein
MDMVCLFFVLSFWTRRVRVRTPVYDVHWRERWSQMWKWKKVRLARMQMTQRQPPQGEGSENESEQEPTLSSVGARPPLLFARALPPSVSTIFALASATHASEAPDTASDAPLLPRPSTSLRASRIPGHESRLSATRILMLDLTPWTKSTSPIGSAAPWPRRHFKRLPSTCEKEREHERKKRKAARRMATADDVPFYRYLPGCSPPSLRLHPRLLNLATLLL